MSTPPERRETYSTIAEVNSSRPEGNRPRENKESAQVPSGAFFVKAILGTGAIVLIIIAFTGVASKTLTAIAAIAVGAGLLLEGMAIAAKYKKILERVHNDAQVKSELGVGVGIETLLGVGVITLCILSVISLVPLVLNAVATIVLGILSLISIAPMLLGQVAFITLGAALLLSGIAPGGRMITPVYR